MKLIIAVLIVMLVGGFGIYMTSYMFNPYKSTSPEMRTIQIKLTEEEIDYNKINQEVIELEKQYFEFKNKTINIKQTSLQDDNNSVTLGQWTLTAKNISGNIEQVEQIEINNEYVKNIEIYRTVFTHEYLHHVLYLMNISMSDDNINEGLTEAFVWYTNKETQSNLFGEKNEFRSFPYTLIMNQIFAQDNFNCLDKVFVKTNKIRDIDDYKKRLINYCNVTI